MKSNEEWSSQLWSQFLQLLSCSSTNYDCTKSHKRPVYLLCDDVHVKSTPRSEQVLHINYQFTSGNFNIRFLFLAPSCKCENITKQKSCRLSITPKWNSDLQPATCNQHPAPCTLHPAPCTLHPATCAIQPAPCNLHPATCNLYPAPCTLYPAPCTLHHVPCTLHPAPCSLHRPPPPQHVWQVFEGGGGREGKFGRGRAGSEGRGPAQEGWSMLQLLDLFEINVNM